jgi:hypothetical protein
VLSIGELSQKAKYVLRREGLLPFLRRVWAFVRVLLFSRGDYYLYEKVLTSGNEVILEPKEPGYTMKLVSDRTVFDELAADGCDFKMMVSKSILEKGALAFCVFSGQELAHLTWVALSNEAKREIDPLPFEVHFKAGEACSGLSFTDPTHRGRGLFGYAYTVIFRHLRERGIAIDRFSIEVGNIPSQRVMAKFDPVITGRGHYLRILWWERWKETPLEGAKR